MTAHATKTTQQADFTAKCQTTFSAYLVAVTAMAVKFDSDPSLALAVEAASPDTQRDHAIWKFRAEVLCAVNAWMSAHHEAGEKVPYTVHAGLRKCIESYTRAQA